LGTDLEDNPGRFVAGDRGGFYVPAKRPFYDAQVTVAQARRHGLNHDLARARPVEHHLLNL
jgi:hypothetical protein